MADGPRQPECAGGIRTTLEPHEEPLGRELARLTVALANAHYGQLALEAELATYDEQDPLYVKRDAVGEGGQ